MNAVMPVIFVLLSAVMQAGAAAMIKYSTRVKQANPGGKRHILIFWIAMFMYGPSFLLWASGLARLNLAVAQPIFSGSMFMFTILLSMLVFKENLRPYKYLGFAAIVAGIAVLVL
jgi:multidrug transporter EmrE-like cation transporter